MANDKAPKTEIEAAGEVKAIHDKIEKWFATFFQNSEISGDTAIYNQCHAAKEELKKIFN